MQYGAAGDGHRDDTKAFVKAWKATCGASGGTPTLNVPSGKTFLLNPLAFEGPCKSPNVQIQAKKKGGQIAKATLGFTSQVLMVSISMAMDISMIRIQLGGGNQAT
ncbi:putative polygalacturonase [Camellia lanceoleosa]|uniref:Polygalacturonase n=1 Tax=Camellia lanceoleosa TaxID=1840588 RepID=A0ACC0FMH6_9ERIC|nr:putative polygalacturonase [Camellia lanceoleosa]